jgi:hypothetical protein
MWVIILPAKTDAPLQVYANAVLARAVAGQRFQAIAAPDVQFLQRPGVV